MRVICAAGARPNFMKVKPVIDALERRGVDTILVHAGQHYDSEMSQVFFDDLGLRPPDRWLGVGSGSHAEQTARVLTAFDPLVAEIDPDIVVVVGDVNATLGCALVAAKSACSLAHVEAGLRSFDWSMPEEVNRVVTDRVSDLLFAPSADAVENLRAEGVPEHRVHLVGNVMVDTLRSNLDRAMARPILADLGLVAGAYGLVTLHRPASVDDPLILSRIVEALGVVAAEIPLVFPVHPRTRTKLADITIPAGLRSIPPAGYLDFLALEAGARVAITDSGGVQEETTVLGVPCLTVRNSTERPITVSEGTNTIVGLEPERLVAAARRALAGGAVPRTPAWWDGHAANRIADVLVG
ncbi:MAG TPA: UDP-N-acetylglucosamine 2-epimerase (non-hydrolyzing) [Acidimicrobiales bacterium]|nr:UDP-N-acetylglucosamine 2-epimerase (non-hydrolyzing) [Acidimicrobiales bacterium]